jgi:hypothetical protein
MTQWLKQSAQSENQTAMEVGALREKEVMMESKLLQRANGLKLWQFQEKNRLKEVERLEKRIEELTRILRSRDAELDQMKVQRSEFEQQISSLQKKASNKRKGLAELPEHRLGFPNPNIHSSHRSGAKLPTLVHTIMHGKNSSTESVSGFSTQEKLPHVDGANNNVVAKKKFKKSQPMFAQSASEPGFKHVKQLMVHGDWVTLEGNHFDLPNVSPPGDATLSWWGGLRALLIPRAVLAGALCSW